MIRVLATLLALLWLALPAAAEKVVAGLSAEDIGLTASFDGSTVLIYGAIKRDAPEPEGRLSVIVTLEGPLQRVTVRRKSREVGIWVNTGKIVVPEAPSYYAVAASAPLEKILPPTLDALERISLPLAMQSFAGPLGEHDTRPYAEALMRIRSEQGAYQLKMSRVKLVQDTLFRADFDLPANLIEGDYKARIFLLRAGTLIDRAESRIRVRRVGLERLVYTLSREKPALYGALSLALAIFAGWAASALFRLIRR
ncbi:TIGR02186 family protein [Rhodobacter lacus]|uniref:TIGR02186 family protein n=1 Tax=Rhodobacter lacus TaxID=1641972 RepID=A0ABW5A9Y1_9RHOB